MKAAAGAPSQPHFAVGFHRQRDFTRTNERFHAQMSMEVVLRQVKVKDLLKPKISWTIWKLRMDTSWHLGLEIGLSAGTSVKMYLLPFFTRVQCTGCLSGKLNSDVKGKHVEHLPDMVWHSFVSFKPSLQSSVNISKIILPTSQFGAEPQPCLVSTEISARFQGPANHRVSLFSFGYPNIIYLPFSIL